jgi:membrane-bound lytic murein transglycosylase D
VHLNRLLTIALSATLALALAHAAHAEENQDLNTHLPFTALEKAVNTPASTETNSTTKVVAPSTQAVTSAPVVTAEEPEHVHVPDDLWQRIRNRFAMRELSSKLIAHHEHWYASRPDYVERMTERAQRYLFYITEEVERRGMPSEIALLPMIESAFNPGANSIARASGIWQFMPATGKNFGMEQNWWYDERRDVISATTGALDYLEKLHDQFGDWELALAAYNWGEGAVSRAQMRNRKMHKPTNFASLRLPRETQNYVPKLLAIKHIINDPEHFGLKLNSIPNRPYFAAVETKRRMDVKLAAELAEIPMEEFIALNPGHNRPVILEKTSSVILLPVDKLETFKTNLEKTNQRLVSWQPYQTKKGEHFDQLAPRFGLSADKLRSINGLSAHAKISSGQTLLVPANDEDAANDEFAAFNTKLVSIDDTHTAKYFVRKKDTLSSIAHRFHVTTAQLQEWNGGISKLRVGQRLTIVQASGNIIRGHRNIRVAHANKNRNTKLVRNNKTQKPTVAKNGIKIASTR